MPNGAVTLIWGDGEHVFNVALIKLAFELEEKCDAGYMEIYTRVKSNRWRINDLRETLRLGLIGGGKTPAEAVVLVRRYFDERPFMESVLVAQAILAVAIVGVPGDEVGKKEEPEGTATEAMDASSAPKSTEAEQGLDGHQEKLTSTPSGSLPLQ